MTKSTVPDYAALINHQIIIQEKMLEHHSKGEAMLKMLLDGNLSLYSAFMIHTYIDVLDDHLNEAKRLNEELLNFLLRIARAFDPPQNPPSGTAVH
jgi:hypothetical protein